MYPVEVTRGHSEWPRHRKTLEGSTLQTLESPAIFRCSSTIVHLLSCQSMLAPG
jgi:hypothetical protein